MLGAKRCDGCETRANRIYAYREREEKCVKLVAARVAWFVLKDKSNLISKNKK